MKFSVCINGYSVTELMELKKDKNDLLSLDRAVGHIKRNKKRYIRLVTILALIIPQNTITVFAMTTDIGMKAYQMGAYVAKAICLLGWLTESIKCVLTGTLDGLGKVSIKWISFALIVKFLPSVVDWIFSV
ncbi:MAG: hypothetical protein ACRDD7_03445 [Peptostreptococcaceae bacterium]